MNLLIDINIVLDVCAGRMPYAPVSASALQYCQNQGSKLWLYAGSLQTMEYNMVREVQRRAESAKLTQRQCATRRSLNDYSIC